MGHRCERRHGHGRREPRLHRHRLLGQGRDARLRRQIHDKFGFIITTSDWNKYGADRSATVSADGTAEVWIDGTKNPDQGESTTVETLDSAPADYACKADTVKVKVHYNRDDGLYYNAEDTSTTVPQWDIWTWSSNWNGGAATFTTHDDWGESRSTPSPTTPTTTTMALPTSACCAVTVRTRGQGPGRRRSQDPVQRARVRRRRQRLRRSVAARRRCDGVYLPSVPRRDHEVRRDLRHQPADRQAFQEGLHG